jgi:DNA-binding GntR family transcriptional regulator
MSDDRRPITGQDEPVITTSKVVTTVFDRVLSAIHEGTLLPGQHISDSEIAEQFGVSRTPVREAIQRLREIGLIEASSGRFTRIVDVTPEQTRHAYIVWQALYSVLVDEVVPRAPERSYNVMLRDNATFLAALPTREPRPIAKANLDFFSRLPPESENAALQRAITSVVHLLSLGSMHLPSFIDLASLSEAQRLLLGAVHDHDLAAAREAMSLLGRIEIPTS